MGAKGADIRRNCMKHKHFQTLQLKSTAFWSELFTPAQAESQFYKLCSSSVPILTLPLLSASPVNTVETRKVQSSVTSSQYCLSQVEILLEDSMIST